MKQLQPFQKHWLQITSIVVCRLKLTNHWRKRLWIRGQYLSEIKYCSIQSWPRGGLSSLPMPICENSLKAPLLSQAKQFCDFTCTTYWPNSQIPKCTCVLILQCFWSAESSKSTLSWVLAWCWTGNKTFPGPMVTSSMHYIMPLCHNV